MKKIFLLLFTLASVMCYEQNTATTDRGVVINGVRWATRNVYTPGTFAAHHGSRSRLYQWNRSTTEWTSGWLGGYTVATTWSRAFNPCPAGWRVPTKAELIRLVDAGSTWTRLNGIYGRLFGTAPNQIFLPAAGLRVCNDYLRNRNWIGYYWSSTPHEEGWEAWHLQITDLGTPLFVRPRSMGFSVRCVAN